MATEKKVLVITGASTGIGEAVAKLAYKDGYQIVLAARSQQKIEALASEIGNSKNVIAVGCDVSDWASQQNLLKRTLEAFGQVDAVFVNAGLSKGSPILGGEDSPEEWKEMILTNVYGVAVTARLFLPELIKTKGHLLLTSSVLGRVTRPGNLYSATKWAVTGMGESIRQLINDDGVRVTVIEPGRVDTPFWKEKPQGPLLSANDVAQSVMFALNQPKNVSINEILVRPTGQII